MKKKRGKMKLSEILNSKPVIGALIFIMLSLASVLAGNVIVKEGSIDIENNLNASNILFVNGSSGLVGIGTTTPQNTLNVVGDINTTGFYYGDGSQLTGISGGIWDNVSGVATYDGNVDINGQADITTLDASSLAVESVAINGYADIGGLELRWGRVTVGANSDLTVTMSRAFTSSCFNLQVTWNEINEHGKNDNYGGECFTKTQIKIQNGMGTSESFHWVAIGS